MFGQINQYQLTQSDSFECYQIRLANLRRLIEGCKHLSTIKKQADDGVARNVPIPNDVVSFFKDMEVEIVYEMNPYYKIIKYKFNNLTPDGDLLCDEF